MVGFPGERIDQISRTFDALNRSLAEDVFIAQVFATAPYGDTPLLKSHKGSIHYSGHFIDIPMNEQDLESRDHMFRSHPEVFSGHYRFNTHEADALVQGVDQFFPLMNEFRYTCLALALEESDPMFVYTDWINHLKRTRRSKGDPLYHTPYYGTFDDFIECLRQILARKWVSSYLEDLFDYENTRYALLRRGRMTTTDSINPQLGLDKPRLDRRLKVVDSVVFKNYRFDVIDVIECIRRRELPTNVALGSMITLSISGQRITLRRLNQLAAEIVRYANDGRTGDDIVYSITMAYRAAGIKESDQIRELCAQTIGALTEAGLLEEWRE